MRWAMAMDDPFTPFEADFNAQRTSLLNNYRSSPELVRIQDILAKALDAKSTKPVSKSKGTISGDSCIVWDFSSPAIEAKYLAKFVAGQSDKYKLKPRDFSVLVRQKAGDYMNALEPSFAEQELCLRNEALQIGPIALQELLAEELSDCVLALLRLFTSRRAGRHWSACLDMMCALRGLALDDDPGRAQAVKDLNEFEAQFRKRYSNPITNRTEAETLIASLVKFIGKPNLLAASPAYRQGDWFDKVVAATTMHLEASCRGAVTWAAALDVYEGLHAIPLMTIHKSKGLEYHTVIFVGLDDGAWWSFSDDEKEATANFFVAFTRAKQRVVFTYCADRGTRTKIAALYNLLTKAGVKTIKMA